MTVFTNSNVTSTKDPRAKWIGRPVPLIDSIISQHVEEAVHLRHLRSLFVDAPHIGMMQLSRLDERIAAHLDGMAIAGEFATALCLRALDPPSVGVIFSATVRAIEEKDVPGLSLLLGLVEAIPSCRSGLTSAFGWVSSRHLQGVVSQLLASKSKFDRRVGISACAMHRVNPGITLVGAFNDSDAEVLNCALRAAGELGQRDTLAAVLNVLLTEGDETCRFWAARSAVILGDRDAAVDRLSEICQVPGLYRERAMRLALCVMDLPYAHKLLKFLAQDPKNIRALIQGAGIAGDPAYIPWLVKHMEDLRLARLAGASFTFITGLDLTNSGFVRRAPEGVESSPNDNPEDEDVSMDEDDGLPWPDHAKVQAWWAANSHRFQPGVRYFMGAPPSWEHCLQVLKDGYQRQRIAAAHYLCLLRPGTPLFNCAAPAWRQKRLLERMS